MESVISTNQTGKALLEHSFDCCDSDEESGWTSYLEDFSSYQKHSIHGDRGVSSAGASALSTSCGRTTSYKRRKTKAVYVDLDLEDTASSPDLTPKGSSISSNKIREGDEQATDLVGKESDYTTELRRKGLCLVPLSMLSNCFS